MTDMRIAPDEHGEQERECCICGQLTLCTYEPDPYAEDVHNDSTPVWECASCRRAQAMEI